MKANTQRCSYCEPLSECPSPGQFYTSHVRKRKPAILRNCAASFLDISDKTTTAWERVEAVLKESKDATEYVQVNERVVHESGADSFSPKDESRVVNMPFSQFLRHIFPEDSPRNDTTTEQSDFYLTTQTLPLDSATGRPELFTFPTSRLMSDFVPLSPAMAGNLIPMSVNLWMGRTHKESSSGLHHDYHDNFYVLLRGTKRFALAPPKSVETFQMHGSLHQLHDNGRIVYKEQLPSNEDGVTIRPDGSLSSMEDFVRLEERREELEQELKKHREMQLRNTDVGHIRHCIAELEGKLDQVEEDLLDFELEDDDGSDDGTALLFGGVSNATSSDIEDASDSDGDTSDGEPCKKRHRTLPPGVPPNFVMGKHDGIDFETATIQAGDVLYLPAGWFHNVESSGGLHAAINYWMHPPDMNGTWEHPYVSNFWRLDWQRRSRGSNVQCEE